MIVVDASVLSPALADRGAHGRVARSRLLGERLAAPQLIDLQVVSVVRRALLARRLDARRASLALRDLADLPLHRAPHPPLLARVWELRDTVAAYDAAYVALAELLDATLLTADARLSRASGPRCPIELLA